MPPTWVVVRHMAEETHVRSELSSAVMLWALNSVLMRQHHSASKRERRDFASVRDVRKQREGCYSEEGSCDKDWKGEEREKK